MNATPSHNAAITTNRLLRGAITVLLAIVVWFLPAPTGVEERAWHLFAIFFGTIIGLILQPLPLGAVVLIGTNATMLTHTLSLNDALA